LQSLSIYNITGNLNLSLDPGVKKEIKIDIRSFNNGFYLISGKKENGSIYWGKFLIVN